MDQSELPKSALMSITWYMRYNQLPRSVLPIWISWNIISISVITVLIFSQFRPSHSIRPSNNTPMTLNGIFIPMWDKEPRNFLYSLIFIRSKVFQSACWNAFTFYHPFTFRYSVFTHTQTHIYDAYQFVEWKMVHIYWVYFALNFIMSLIIMEM